METTTIFCPYCNSDTLVILDGVDGDIDLVSDCENCCRPIFSSKKLALKWMSQLRLSLHSGEFWSRLSLEEQRDIIHAYSFAKSKGQLLSRCLTTPSESPKRLSSSLSKAIDGYQSVLQQKSLRPASLEQTRRFLGQLADLFGNEQAHLVSASHLENWFESRNWKRSTIDGVIA